LQRPTQWLQQPHLTCFPSEACAPANQSGGIRRDMSSQYRRCSNPEDFSETIGAFLERPIAPLSSIQQAAPTFVAGKYTLSELFAGKGMVCKNLKQLIL
jgi:hypothetical protein